MAKQYDTLDDVAMSHLAEVAMKRYAPSLQGKLTLLCRSENATYRLDAGGKRYAMRIHRENYHQRDEIACELAWLSALSAEGIAVPQALGGVDGDVVQTVILADGTPRHVVLFHWIEGEMPTTEVDARAFEQLGMITARLHQHSRNWQQPAQFRRIIWDHQTMVGSDGHWGRWQDAPRLQATDHTVIEETLHQVGEALDAYGKDSQRYGLIHADLRLTNLLMFKGETRVIDFDDCGFGWYLHDLAAAISFVEHHPRADAWVAGWLRGYQRICPLTDADMAVIPALLIQRRIQLMAWAGSHAQTEQAKSLGDNWSDHSVRLCRRYLEKVSLPVGCD
ncbi:phosphotransferase enzyme family protein [Brenneria uluponensis]|uniref:phosphotransferase enzyme family protein n=1 Tax=Brenneria uluponensis TaxID=3057057 RepID=UPI0028F13874|nr:phosphotransferase [Brenneria ulupoensis]